MIRWTIPKRFRRRWIRKDSQHPHRPTVAERLHFWKAHG